MTEPKGCPDGVELARPSDEDAILDLLRLKHAEDGGVGRFPAARLRNSIRRGMAWDTGCIGVIRADGKVVASAGLFLDDWCWPVAPDLHLAAEWIFVHPRFRRSDHLRRLGAFAHWAADRLGRPLVLVHVVNGQTAPMGILYEKAFGGRHAHLYVYDPTGRIDERRHAIAPKQHVRVASGGLQKLSRRSVRRLMYSGHLAGPDALAASERRE